MYPTRLDVLFRKSTVVAIIIMFILSSWKIFDIIVYVVSNVTITWG